ncbi:MAG: Fur family ferric uptake transcriptional regulator [Desulforhopalus sp.]|jgi:Fur family ferric uptake transcriptional regulator
MQLRMTNQREMILRELVKNKQHLTADELYDIVKKVMPRISLATVYRNLEILSEAGIIGKLEISGRQKRFDYDPEDHDHIYCVVCHRVDNLNIERTGDEVQKLESVEGYSVTGYRLEIIGICESCQKKEKTKETKK